MSSYPRRSNDRTILLALLLSTTLHAQPRAILADGPGPWVNAHWTFAVSEFRSLLTDAGYSVETVAPGDLSAALNNSDILVAVPSLENFPADSFVAINNHVNAGGSLMASGGQPFRNLLYLTTDGRWLDAQAYLQAVGTAPPNRPPAFMPPIPTVWSANSIEQFTNSAGLRVPVTHNRGLFSSGDSVRYRVIGDLLTPAATLCVVRTTLFLPSQNPVGGQAFIAWLPWPQLLDPLRAELVAALRAAPNRLSIYAAGADHLVWLPGEAITGSVVFQNMSTSPVQVSLQWSISGASGVAAQPATELNVSSGQHRIVQLQFPRLENGDYTLHFRLMRGTEELDRADSPLRVLNPTLTRQPDQKIRVVDGRFIAGGRHVFLRGVNYWPRSTSGRNGTSWFRSDQYDPDLVEADLTRIAALHFNLLHIQFIDYHDNWAQEGRNLIDFLERCRNHGLWVQIALHTTVLNGAYAGQVSPELERYLQAAFLPGNDRVLAYELLWEPMLGLHNTGGQGRIVNGAVQYNTGRMVLDPDWRSWVNDQYGSLDNAQQAWGFTAPRDTKGQLTNPLDAQMQNDGPWRIMVAAYRRFLDDYLGRNLGLIARQIRRTDPDTLLGYRNWATMTTTHNEQTGYDIGAGAAHLDFVSPERYSTDRWPDSRSAGLITAYSRYRSGGKPVVWAEYGANIGDNGGTPASRELQDAVCDGMMRIVAEDGSSGASVWWWPGGLAPNEGSDFGISNPDGTPRACANTLAQWNATFAADPPDQTPGPSTTFIVDRDTDARGSYGLFLNNQDRYVQAKQAGQSVVLVNAGTNTDTWNMPLIQVGNVPYSGSGPLKFANGEIAELHVVCPTLDATIENGSTLAIPFGSVCQVTPTLVNTGEARWLGVILHTNIGDVSLPTLPSLQKATIGPLSFTAGQSLTALRGRLNIPGIGDFGEVLNLNLNPACPVSVNPAGPISIPAGGGSGTLNITAASDCYWDGLSDQPWLAASASGFAGNGVVNYRVAANYGPKRQATLGAGINAFTVTQDRATSAPLVQAPQLSAANLSFGSRVVNTASPSQTIQLMNPGPGVMSLHPVAVGGVASTDFSVSDDCGTLLAGERCNVQVVFTPAAPGTRTASLYVAGNLSSGSVISLSGSGVIFGPTPEIQAIVDAWGYTRGIAPGLWVTLGGTNFAGPAQVWDLSNSNQLPVSLGVTRVTFNGAPAALLYVSPTQINALVPSSVAPGKVDVVVEVNGLASSPFTMTAQPVQPAVYAPPTPDGSTFFVTAALAGTATLIGNSATDPRVLRAAYPGDILDLYMIGMGSTVDPAQFITDRVFAGGFLLNAPVTATLGGRPAAVSFAGLTTPGLYLVRLTVPSDLPAGAQPIQVSAGGIPSRSSLVLQVGQP